MYLNIDEITAKLMGSVLMYTFLEAYCYRCNLKKKLGTKLKKCIKLIIRNTLLEKILVF